MSIKFEFKDLNMIKNWVKKITNMRIWVMIQKYEKILMSKGKNIKNAKKYDFIMSQKKIQNKYE